MNRSTRDSDGNEILKGDVVALNEAVGWHEADARYSVEQIFKNGKVKLREIDGDDYGHAFNAKPEQVGLLKRGDS